jgi:hypothetical protein
MSTSGFDSKLEACCASGLKGNSVVMVTTLPLLVRVANTSFQASTRGRRTRLASRAPVSHQYGAPRMRAAKRSQNRMDTPNELAAAAHLETVDSSRAHCHKCRRSDYDAELVWCGYGSCGNSICCECATETEWDLEACSDEHAAAIARWHINQLHELRRRLYAQKDNWSVECGSQRARRSTN